VADLPDTPLVPGTTLRFSGDGAREPAPEDCLAHARAVQIAKLPHERYGGSVGLVSALHLQGYRIRTIQAALKMSRIGVEWCLREARRRGELTQTLEHALQTIDTEAVPLAVESLLSHLRRQDKELTWKVLAGRGMFPHLTKAKTDGPSATQPMAFQFNFVMPDGSAAQDVEAAAQPVLPGQIVGTERPE
jgi:hypothetical protein